MVAKNTKSHAPFTHDLRRLAKLTDLDFAEDFNRYLDTITTFNLNARYDDLLIEPHPFKYSDFNLTNPVVAEIIKDGIDLKNYAV